MPTTQTADQDEMIASLRALLRSKDDEIADLRRDLSRSTGRVEFANPGSALRAASHSNPRNLPCPTCGEDDRLTPEDARLGYHCDECADRAEGRGGYE
jgi:hypothetical protein